MYYPCVSERVRVRGREGEFIVISIDHAAYAVHIRALGDHMAIEKDVPFDLLSASPDEGATTADLYDGEGRSAVIRNVLLSSQEHINRTSLEIADLQNSISTTLGVIHASRQLIEESDRVIARARNAEPEASNQA